jgi:Raf kinase inhibitor-like YbhB/YbcL family protein
MRSIMYTLLLVAAPALAGTAKMVVSSSAFPAGGAIPDEYTCAGSDISPQLAWSSTPATAKSIALVVEDPDAPKGTVLHWLVTGLDPAANGLVKGGALPDGAVAAKNEKGNPGYMGPCPPAGPAHHYHFHVYALDAAIAKPATKADLMTEMKGHIVGEGELIGTYQKK